MSYSSLPCDELVRACAESGNTEAWQEFICRFGPLINRIVMRVARRYGESRRELIEELAQETYSKFCANGRKLLRNFEHRYQNAFYAMAAKVAANVVHDNFRKPELPIQPFPSSDVEFPDAEASIPDPHADEDGQFTRPILFQEIDKLLRSAFSPRDREIFWLHHQQGLTAAEIAAIPYYGLKTKGVESLLHRMKGHLRENYSERSQPPGK
jgi:RNA polymerase sigma factor (sigma-70 family)